MEEWKEEIEKTVKKSNKKQKKDGENSQDSSAFDQAKGILMEREEDKMKENGKQSEERIKIPLKKEERIDQNRHEMALNLPKLKQNFPYIVGNFNTLNLNLYNFGTGPATSHLASGFYANNTLPPLHELSNRNPTIHIQQQQQNMGEYKVMDKEDMENFAQFQRMGSSPPPYVPKKMSEESPCSVVDYSNKLPDPDAGPLEKYPTEMYVPPALQVFINGTVQPCQIITTWLFMYVQSMKLTYPFIDIPLSWKLRMDHTLKDPVSSSALYAEVSLQYLFGDSSAFYGMDLNDLIDATRVKIMMAFGARFAGNVQEAQNLMNVAKEMIKPIQDQMSLALGWTFFLMNLYYVDEADIFNVIWANSCSISVAKRMKLVPVDSEAATFLDVSAHCSSLSTSFDLEERKYIHQYLSRNSLDKVQASVLFLTEIFYQFLLEIRSGVPAKLEKETNITMMTFPMITEPYHMLLEEIVALGHRSFLFARENNVEEAMRHADCVAKLTAKGINYCSVGVPSSLLFCVFTYHKLDKKGDNYYYLIKICERYSKIFPSVGWLLRASPIPTSDIEKAHSMTFE
eukprot:TRINITY_DN5872_c0_g1_i1.p1 TRINITY_DN5872_c0_g1~~TRINITY_DN5872_c0_g1_i1.p1  ORF type:complete len:570 (+),score=166.76 TRINITY_DN5872_c0_g1_i1:258-1967(+)